MTLISLSQPLPMGTEVKYCVKRDQVKAKRNNGKKDKTAYVLKGGFVGKTLLNRPPTTPSTPPSTTEEPATTTPGTVGDDGPVPTGFGGVPTHFG